MTDEVRQEPSLDGETVLLANDPQIEETRRRKLEGIPVSENLLEEFQNIASDLKVDVNL